jgi:hypothetical protein
LIQVCFLYSLIVVHYLYQIPSSLGTGLLFNLCAPQLLFWYMCVCHILELNVIRPIRYQRH